MCTCILTYVVSSMAQVAAWIVVSAMKLAGVQYIVQEKKYFLKACALGCVHVTPCSLLCAVQFERTLIIAEDDSQVSYLEGCTAPSYDTNQVSALCCPSAPNPVLQIPRKICCLTHLRCSHEGNHVEDVHIRPYQVWSGILSQLRHMPRTP